MASSNTRDSLVPLSPLREHGCYAAVRRAQHCPWGSIDSKTNPRNLRNLRILPTVAALLTHGRMM
jgi:hypothetical protein